MAAISREQIETLKAQAMIAEKGTTHFSIRLSVIGGRLDDGAVAEHCRVGGAFRRWLSPFNYAARRRNPACRFQNLDLLRTALEEAGLMLAATGKCVRGIVACPGSYCLRGLIDSQGVAQRLHARFGTRKGLPHKFKIAVAGCMNGCTKPKENDLGILGRYGGFTVFVGGKMGKQPRWADALPLDISDEAQLFQVVESVIDWFVAEGQPGERFGSTIDRVGLNALIEHLRRS